MCNLYFTAVKNEAFISFRKIYSCGAIWFVFNPVESLIQIFTKKNDEEKGNIRVEVSSFSFKTISSEGGVSIFEVHHIDGTDEEISKKDDSEFESKSKKAS